LSLNTLWGKAAIANEPTDKILTVPNLLTLLRLLLLPLFFFVFTVVRDDVLAFVIFLVAASTDFLDGLAARRLGQVSRIGQQFDPLVDRLLIIAGVLGVFVLGRLPLWVLVVFLSRDAVLLCLTVYLRTRLKRPFEVVFLGKLATAVVMAGFCLLILNLPQLDGVRLLESPQLPGWGEAPASLGMWLLYAGTVLSVATACVYLRKGYLLSKAAYTPHKGARSTGRMAAPSDAPVRLSARPWAETAQRPAKGTGSACRAATGRSSSHVAAERPSSRAPKEPAHKKHASTKGAATKGAATKGAAKKGASAKRPSRRTKKRGLSSHTMRALIAVFVPMLLIGGFYGIDALLSNGRIHGGVSVAGVDVGGLTTEEASERLQEELTSRADSRLVTLYRDEQGMLAGPNEQTVDLAQGVTAYSAPAEGSEPPSSWSVSSATTGLSVDGPALAARAFAVGRGPDFLLGRLAATFQGVRLPGSLDFSPAQLAALEETLTLGLGWQVQEADIALRDGSFAAVDGKDGLVADHDELERLLDEAFLGDNPALVVPMEQKARLVDEHAAALVAQQANAATLDPVALLYEGDSWELSRDALRSLVATHVEYHDGAEGMRADLVPTLDAGKLRDGLTSYIGGVTLGVAPSDARFESDGAGGIHIVESEKGTGVDYDKLAIDLGAVVFPASRPTTAAVAATAQSARRVTVPTGVLEPEFSTADARALKITDKIASFTTYYSSSTATRRHNIHLASSYINGSLIAPGSTWSFHTTVGDCTAERGFQQDIAIVNNELVDEIGGGVCQVATTVYNAVFEAGLPIVERTNHSLYVAYYPDGRDAAVAWPGVDLKFENSTPDWMVLIMEYDYSSLTATLWGTDPGYTVEAITGEWMQGTPYETKEVENPDMLEGERKVKTAGKDGKVINVTRIVRDKDGNVVRESVIKSRYNPVLEVVEVGTKPRPPEEKPPDDAIADPADDDPGGSTP
jgi:CDP-diacylglycerol--glycerol-3-phosphate 3-phosphatidyltransferase